MTMRTIMFLLLYHRSPTNKRSFNQRNLSTTLYRFLYPPYHHHLQGLCDLSWNVWLASLQNLAPAVRLEHMRNEFSLSTLRILTLRMLF
jgi:hypothetical protein